MLSFLIIFIYFYRDKMINEITSDFGSQGFSIESTFDSTMPNIEQTNEIISPLTSLMGQKTEAITFTHKFFLQRPDLFGVNAETLMYAQHAGHKYKPASYYNIFELFIKQRNENYINDKRNNGIENIYAYDNDYLITWARIIRSNKIILEFEPVMRQLKNVFNNWLSNKKVYWGGILYPIDTFKPLCYTNSGECFISLLPYICYLFTFFIHCYPYEFDEGQSESSTFGFYKSLESWYMKHYTELGNDFDVDIIKGSIESLSKIGNKYWIDMFEHMLNVDDIIKIRNDEISRTPELLEQCISSQNGLSMKYITRAWNDVMTNLIKIVIANSPIKKIFDSIPRFDPNSLDINELMMWTQYCMSGGNKPFCIEPDLSSINVPGKTPNYSFMFHGDPTSIKKLPSSIIGDQSLKSNIKQLTISKLKPFTCSDLLMEMCTSYVKKEFMKKKTDILDDNPININESMLRNDNLFDKPLSQLVKDLFINGLWMYDNSSMSSALNLLLTKNDFVEEVSDILSLGSVTQMVYDNRMASIVITTYILSYLNTWLLDTCINGYNFHTFSPYAYVPQIQPSSNRIAKLLNMVTSFLYISDPMYCRFVNVCIDDFTGLVTMNSLMQQPYIKGLNDLADIYAIGGCELYNYSHFTNPLIRGYGFVATVFGNCEALESFYKWIYKLDNDALFEVINESLNNVSLIETSLKAQWSKMWANRSGPTILHNFTFTSSGYRVKSVPYFLDLSTSDGTLILNLICRYTFPYSNPRTSINRQIMFRPIEYNKGKLTAKKPAKNGMSINNSLLSVELSSTGTNECIPVYDFNGSMEDVNIIFTNPNGMRLEKFILFNSRINANQTIWLFTKVPISTRFQKYMTMKNSNGIGSSPKSSEDSMSYRIDSDLRKTTF